MMGFGYGGFGMGPIGWIIQLIVLIGVVYLIVYLIRSSVMHNNPSRSHTHSAKEILAERFARGEISEEEYKKMKDALK